MTDLLARPADAEPGTEPRPGGRGEAGPAGPDIGTAPVRWFLAGLLVGAAAIHLAMAPSHLGESAVEGAGFLAAAWAQVLLAAAVVLRPTRRILTAVGAASVALIAAWAVSRTAGLPFGAHRGHAESVSVVDGICVALEVGALLVAVGLLSRAATVLTGARRAALVGAVGAVALATGAIASPDARDHAAASHGDHGTVAGDHGTAAGGHGHGAAAAGDDLGFSELQNGQEHPHAEEDGAPLTADERVLLAQQLAATAELVERYPTIGDAEAAGWTRAGPFSPGLGVHYTPPDDTESETPGSFAQGFEGTMDPENMPTPVLIFDGLESDAPLAGFMYLAYGVEDAPEGFAGPNDHWHLHESVCITVENGEINTPFGADRPDVTEEMCTDIGGQWLAVTGYMVHVWSVPGYESPDGMFTELNPKLTCPDGTYYTIDIEDLGNRETLCRSA